MEKKKTLEFNFVTILLIIIILFVLVFIIARKTGTNIITEIAENITQSDEEEYSEKLYSKNVITIDEGKLNSNWEIIDEEIGSIIFYIQGPKEENEDGTYNEIKINFYLQESEMTNDELKTQMLENSIYSDIEYTKIQEINSLQWMEFEAQNKGVKAKILTLMKDGYMYAAEITGEENYYNNYYNEAMKVVMTIQIAERIDTEVASELIYNYDNLANIKEGGTQYLLTSLNLPETMEQTEENTNLPEEYQEYVWTGINYDDFYNEMRKYMTDEVLKSQFSEFINYNGCLYVKETTGTQVDYMINEVNPILIEGDETTYEVIKIKMTTYETVKQQITIKQEDGNCVVSNVG